MRDLFFNELSIDSTYYTRPTSREEAKQLVIKFVRTCLSYILSCGLGSEVYMNTHKDCGLFLRIMIMDSYNIGEILSELEQEGILSYEEFNRFKSFVGESFTDEWNPEYWYESSQCYGLGEAYEKNTFAISFNNWEEKKYRIIKREALSADREIHVRNISTSEHVIKDHKVWQDCSFINKVKNENILPMYMFSKYIFQALGYSSISEFYSNLAGRVSEIKLIGKIIARLNGWQEYIGCENHSRIRFESNGYYLAIDTQHAAFEVYSGSNNHLGEILFYKENINRTRANRGRTICD